jgi:beta-lactamase superfamily II metal-dependent hydrolase
MHLTTSPNIILKVLPVLHGDAFCIQFSGNDDKIHNIFIDGGFACTYLRTLKKEAKRVSDANEKIDLFIITHTDQDHISGVLKFVKDYGETNLVEQYWFNHSDVNMLSNKASNKISIPQGIKLREYLKNRGKLLEYDVTDEMDDIDCYGAKLIVLSPQKLILEEYKNLWNKEEKCPKKSSKKLISSEENDYSYSIEQLAKNSFREDSKLENGVSIAFLFQVHGKTILFLADSYPSTIINSFKDKGYDKLKVDYVKLSHHASKSNTNDELLSFIDCDKYIISANGKNQYHFPHKESLARILNHSQRDFSRQITFIFNYNNNVLQNIFTEEEKRNYNFLCSYPNKNENGFTIKL